MAPQKQTSVEQTNTQPEKTPDFQASLDSILNRPLDPETIDTYADKALGDLIDLSERIVASYRRQPTHEFDGAGEIEDAAFNYFGLGDIDSLLAHLVAKSEQIHHYDEIIEKLKSSGEVIIPTRGHASISAGGGEFEHKALVPRLKTLLMILAEDFDVNVDDSEQITLRKGIVTSEMMRKESYVMVEVPKLSRTILVCDEEGNVTYVLDSAKLADLGISSDELAGLTKSDLNYYLDEQPGLGKRLIYNKKFVANMIRLIDGSADTGEAHEAPETGQYLIPRAPEGVLSTNALARKWKMADATVARAIEELGDTLGEAKQYKFFTRIAKGYDASQQEIIRQHLDAKDLIAQPASEDILSSKALAKSLNLDPETVQRAIDELGDSIGEVERYRFGGRTAPGYGAGQREMILRHLEAKSLLIEMAPEEVLSTVSLAKKLRIAKDTVQGAVDELGDALGEVKQYRFGSQPTNGYDASQQEIIRQHLETKGALKEQASEQVLSAGGLAHMLKVSHAVVQRAIDELGGTLGEVEQYKFATRTAAGFDASQQEIIRQHLEEKGALIEQAPQGILSAGGLAHMLKVYHSTVQRAIDELGDTLGEVKQYKFGGRVASGYNTDQVRTIERFIVTNSPRSALAKLARASINAS